MEFSRTSEAVADVRVEPVTPEDFAAPMTPEDLFDGARTPSDWEIGSDDGE